MLNNLDFIKATVNGNKCGFVVFNGSIYLLSYVREWGGNRSADLHRDPTALGDDFPRHGFHRGVIIWMLEGAESTWQVWRNIFIRRMGATFGIESIAFQGEEGFEREVRRRRANRVETANETTLQDEGEGIDFYLPNYTCNMVYRGQNSYHASHRSGYLNQPRVPYSGHRIGVELEIEATSDDNHSEIIRKTSNWYTRESDSSLGSYGIELITIPLLPSDAKSHATWQPLVDFLKSRAKSWGTTRCGLHVHIGREILGDNENEQQLTLGKLLIFYQGDIETWDAAKKVFGRDRCYHQPDGNTEEIKAVKVLGKNVLKDPDVYSKVDESMKRCFSTSRYYAVNLANTHTIEFRKGRGSINAERIIAVITFTESICLFCRETAAHELTIENFKQWLFRNVPSGNPVYRYLEFNAQDC